LAGNRCNDGGYTRGLADRELNSRRDGRSRGHCHAAARGRCDSAYDPYARSDGDARSFAIPSSTPNGDAEADENPNAATNTNSQDKPQKESESGEVKASEINRNPCCNSGKEDNSDVVCDGERKAFCLS
jgi:hypothetical protein